MSGPVLPGVIRQIGYIVQDFDKALDEFLALGVGPFYVLRGIEQTGIYRGQDCTVKLTLGGLANSGDMQIEIIHQDNDAPSIYSEFTSAGGGMVFTSGPTGPRTTTPPWRPATPRGVAGGVVGWRCEHGPLCLLRTAVGHGRDDHRADGAHPGDDRDG